MFDKQTVSHETRYLRFFQFNFSNKTITEFGKLLVNFQLTIRRLHFKRVDIFITIRFTNFTQIYVWYLPHNLLFIQLNIFIKLEKVIVQYCIKY